MINKIRINIGIILLLLSMCACTDMFRSDIVPPVVFIINPKDGADALSGVVNIRTKVYDNSGIAKVEFIIDDEIVKTDTKSPYNYLWNVAFWDLRISHVINVRVVDKEGNETYAEPVNVELSSMANIATSPVYPDSNSVVDPDNVTLIWRSTYDAVQYNVEFADRASFDNITQTIQTGDTSITLALERNEYFWRVMAVNDRGISSGYSKIGHFFAGERLFVSTFGESQVDEYGNCIVQTSDQGYLIAGTLITEKIVSWGTNYRRSNLQVIKFDSLGYFEWEQLFGTMKSANDILLTYDDNVVMAGVNPQDNPEWIMIDPEGNEIWSSSISENGVANDILKLSNGNYLITGAVNDDIFILECDPLSGSIIRQKHYAAADIESGHCSVETISGNWVILGDRNDQLLVFQTNSSGLIQWEKTYSHTNSLSGVALFENQSGGYHLFANAKSSPGGAEQMMLIVIDTDGNELGRESFDNRWLNSAASVIRTDDGNYCVFGNTGIHENIPGDFWMLKLDANGNEIWERIFGKVGNNFGSGLHQCDDNGYILTGTLDVPNSVFGSHRDMILIKTDINGRTRRYWFY